MVDGPRDKEVDAHYVKSGEHGEDETGAVELFVDVASARGGRHGHDVVYYVEDAGFDGDCFWESGCSA